MSTLFKASKSYIIQTIKDSGQMNMNIDLFMLAQTSLNKDVIFTLRFYTWDGDWISIGRNQKNLPEKWLELSRQGLINIVRRPSGGGAVLHSGGITYAITFKKSVYERFSYEKVNHWLKKSFNKLNIILKNGTIKKSAFQENCFSSSLNCDLVDQNGFKRIGSAIYSQKGSFLQHGEIQLHPPKALWLKIFNEKAPPPFEVKLSKNEIIKHLKNCFMEDYSNKLIEDVKLNYSDLKEMMNTNIIS